MAKDYGGQVMADLMNTLDKAEAAERMQELGLTGSFCTPALTSEITCSGCRR